MEVFRKLTRFIAGHKVAAFALILMCGQNTTHTLLIRHSRGVLHETYSASTNVLLVEIVKLLLCAAVMAKTYGASICLPETTSQSESTNKSALLSTLSRMYLLSLRRSWKVFVPACLYFIQNVLSFIALQNLEAGVFAVLVQLKTFTTAVFSVLLLKKHLTSNQWRSLCLLVLAAILIESPTEKCIATNMDNTNANAKKETTNNAIGVAAVLGIATLSGFAGVYFEKVLKSAEATLWERNFQLSAYSIIFALLSIIIFDGEKVWNAGFFAGYSASAIGIVFTSAAGGILVAVVVKYTDNIIKSFATAIAICLTSLLSIPLLGATLSRVFWVGALMVVLSIFNYADATPGPTRSSSSSNNNHNNNNNNSNNLTPIHTTNESTPANKQSV